MAGSAPMTIVGQASASKSINAAYCPPYLYPSNGPDSSAYLNFSENRSASFMTKRSRTGFPEIRLSGSSVVARECERSQRTVCSISSPQIRGDSSKAKPGSGLPSAS